MKKRWIIGRINAIAGKVSVTKSASVEENTPHGYVISFELQFRKEKGVLESLVRGLGKTA
jgi:hypothetical protein